MIDLIWSSIEKDVVNGKFKGICSRLIHPDAFYRIFLAVEALTRKRLLMFELPYSNLKKIEIFPRSRGFEVEIKKFGQEEEENFMTVIVSVTHVQYNDFFSIIAKDISEHIKKETDADKFIESFINRLARWQYFLEKFMVNGLGEERQRGLIAELWFLKKLILSDIDNYSSVLAWTGT